MLKKLKTHHFFNKTLQFDVFELKNIIFFWNFALSVLGISRLTLKIWNPTSEKCIFQGLKIPFFQKFSLAALRILHLAPPLANFWARLCL